MPRGRPRKPDALTASERNRASDAKVVAAGGRIISRLVLSPTAAAALARLAPNRGEMKLTIERAIIEADKAPLLRPNE